MLNTNDDDLGDSIFSTPPTPSNEPYQPYKTFGIARQEVTAKNRRLATDDDLGESIFAGAPPPAAKESTGGDFQRGFGVAFKQLKQTGAGTVALAADAVGAKGVRDWGLQKYKEVGDEIDANAARTDNFTEIENAGDLVDWAQYGAGYVVAQGIQALASAGIGALVAKAVIRKGLESVVAGQIEKQVAAGVAKEQALKNASQSLGAALGMGALNYSQEAGSIYGDAVDEAIKKGGTVDDVNKARVAGSAAVAAGIDTVVDRLNMKGLFKGIGTGSLPARVAKAGLWTGLRESLTEGAQTVIERYGASQDLSGTEAMSDYINSMALGALGGAGVGGVSGIRGKRQTAAPQPGLNDLPEEDISARPGERVPADPTSEYAADAGRLYGVDLGVPTAAQANEAQQALIRRQADELLAQIEGRAPGTPPVDPFEGLYASPPEPAPERPLGTPEAGIAELTGNAAQALQRPQQGRPPILDTVSAAQADLAPPSAPVDVARGPLVNPQATPQRGIAEMTPPANLVRSVAAGAGGRSSLADTIAKSQAALDRLGARNAAATQRAAPEEAARVAAQTEQAQEVGQPAAQDAAQAPATPVPQTTREPQGDIAAQLAALADPNNPKDAVFIATGTPVPPVPKGVVRVNKPQGIFLTTNFAKAQAIRGTKKLTDEEVAAFLSIPEPKSAVLAAGEPAVVQAKDAQGNVASAALTSGSGANEAAVASQVPPGGSVSVTSPVTAQRDRAGKVKAEKAAPATEQKVALVAPEVEQTKPAKKKSEPKGWMPEVKQEDANDVVSFNGTDYNDNPARLDVRMVDGKIVDARIVSEDKEVRDVGIKVKPKDTIQTIVARIEASGDFTREGEKKADINANVTDETVDDNLDGEDATDDGPPEKAQPSQADQKNEAIQSFRKKVRKALRVERGQVRVEIEPDAPMHERSEWANEKLAPEFGMEQSIELVVAPPNLKTMQDTMRRLFGVNIQFFKPKSPKVDAALEGVFLPGDPHTIYVSTSIQNPALFVIGHEFGHSLKNRHPALFAAFVQEALPALKKAETKAYAKKLAQQMRDANPRRSEVDIAADVNEEIASDAIASSFMDPDFWETLTRSAKPEAGPLIARVLQELSAFLKGVLTKFRAIAEARAGKMTSNESLRKHLVSHYLKTPETHRASNLIRDITQLNSSVRELLARAYPDLTETLSEDELTGEARQFYMEKMDPEVAWGELTPQMQEAWVDAYELYRDGEIAIEDRKYDGRTIPGLMNDYNLITKAAKANLKIDKQEQSARERQNVQDRHDAETYFDNAFSPKKFDDLSEAWQNAFVAKFIAERNGKKISLESEGRKALAGMRRAAEQREKLNADLKEAHEEAVANHLAEATLLSEMLTPAQREKAARALGHKGWTKRTAPKFIEIVSEALALPAGPDRFKGVPSAMRPMVRKFVSERIDPRVNNRFDVVPRFSRKDSQVASPEFRAWFGDSVVKKGMSKADISRMRYLDKLDDQDKLGVNERRELQLLTQKYVERNDPVVYYHGSTADIEAFQPMTADAIFISPSAKFASDYVGAGWRHHEGKAPSVYPVFVRAENPFDYENKSHRDALLNELESNPDVMEELALEGFSDPAYDLKLGLWNLLEQPSVQDAIRGLGHDGFFMWEGGLKNLAVYNANQLKAAYGNVGAFDINDDRIRYSRKDGDGNPDQRNEEAGSSQRRGVGQAHAVGEGVRRDAGARLPDSFREEDSRRAEGRVAAYAQRTFAPNANAKARWAKRGVSAPPLYELRQNTAASSRFRDYLLAAQGSQSDAGPQVTVYSADEYAGMRMFLTNDGKAGFAIKPDGEIVSVFKHADAAMIGVSEPMLHLAVQQGGRWLNAFDTFLPRAYEKAGFMVVSRTPFNEQFAPEGWNYDAMSDFNNGRPDVVFMVYNGVDGGNRRGGEMFDDYDAAEKVAKGDVPPAIPRFSRKSFTPVTEVYATKGKDIVGMASYNATDKVWSVWKSDRDIRDVADLKDTKFASTEDALNALRGQGVRLVRRKASPYMEGQTDAWGRGPDALVEIDNDPKPGNNAFTKSMDAVVSAMNRVWGSSLSGPELRRDFIRKVQDQYIDIASVQDAIRAKGGVISGAANLYQHITLYPGRTGAQMADFERSFGEPMEKAIEAAIKNGATLDDIETWLIARHAPERNAVIEKRTEGKNKSGSGMTDEEAKSVLRESQTKPYANDLDQIGKIADDVSAFKLQTMLNAGLISQEAHDELAKYQHYVPLKGMDDDDTGELTAGFGIGTGTGFSGKGTLLRYATGRDTKAKHVISHLLLDAEAKIVRAGKNEVAKSLLKLAEDFPDPKFWTVNEVKAKPRFDPESGTVKMQADNGLFNENVILAYVDGNAQKIELHDPSMANAMVAAGAAGQTEWVNALRRFNGWMSQMVTTYNPVWALVNGLRDAQTAYFNIKADTTLPPDMAKKVVSTIAGMKARGDIWKMMRDPTADNEYARLYRELEHAGGITHFFGVTTLEDRARKMKELEDRVLKKNLPAAARDAWIKSKVGPMVADFLQDMGATIEAVPRVAAYKALIDAGWSKADAADYAKNLTVNFNRKGSQKLASAAYLFFNPAVQGTARLYKAAKTPEGKAIMAGLFVAGFMAGITGNSAGDDDDNGVPDYQQLSDWERATNIILWPNGPKIPLPYGWNAPYAAGNFLSDVFFGRGAMSASWKAMKAAVDAFDPISGADAKNALNWFVKQATPTIVDPLVQLALNDNVFGSTIYQEPSKNYYRPASESGRSSVGAVWRESARALNRATGGSATVSGAVDVNPNVLDHLFSGYLPGWPQESVKTIGTAVDMASGARVEARQAPGWRRVWAEPGKTDYEGLSDAKELLTRLAAQSKGDAEDRAALTKDYPGWLGVKTMFDLKSKKVADLYKRKAAIIDGKLRVPDSQKEQERIDDEVVKLNNDMLRVFNEAKQRWPG